jgi:hypothetical protein
MNVTRDEEWADPEIQLLLNDLKHSIERFLHRKLDVSDNQIEQEPVPVLLPVPAPNRVSARVVVPRAKMSGSTSSGSPQCTPAQKRLAL